MSSKAFLIFLQNCFSFVRSSNLYSQFFIFPYTWSNILLESMNVSLLTSTLYILKNKKWYTIRIIYLYLWMFTFRLKKTYITGLQNSKFRPQTTQWFTENSKLSTSKYWCMINLRVTSLLETWWKDLWNTKKVTRTSNTQCTLLKMLFRMTILT